MSRANGIVDIVTCTGAHLRGQVSWDAIEADVVWVTGERHTTVLRASQIESFTLNRRQVT